MEWRKRSGTLLDLNGILLETGHLSDVTFLVGPEKAPIQAHIFILSTRSSVFEVMFGDCWKNSERKTNVRMEEVPDVQPQAFKEFLKILYTDIKGKIEFPIEVLYLGEKYDVPDVVSHCITLLTSSIQFSTVLGIYEAAKLFDLHSLKGEALIFMLKNAPEFFQHEDFEKMDIETLVDLLSSDSLALDEVTVFKSILIWGVANEKETEARKRLVPLVRFPLMSSQDFSIEVVKSGILSDEEVIQMFLYFNATEFKKKDVLQLLPFNGKPRVYEQKKLLKFSAFGEIHSVGVYLATEICSSRTFSYTYGPKGKLHEEPLDFIVDRDVNILGVGLYGPKNQNRSLESAFRSYAIQLTLFTYDVTGTQRVSVTQVIRNVTTRADYEVYFSRKVLVSKDRLYHIRLAFKGEETRHGISKLSHVSTICKNEKLTFNFLGPIGTYVGEGRIRSILFSLPSNE